MSQNHTVKPPNGKPGKPFSGYPLYAHASGRWAKKVRGKTHFFGPWGDPEGALRNWTAWKDDLLAGRTPRDKAGALTLRDLVNQYLNSKRRMVASGEMVERTWHDYDGTCGRLIRYFGKDRRVDDITAADFGEFKASLYKNGLGHVSVANEVRRTRGLFKWGYDAGLVQNMPRYGQEFKKPSARVLRLDKAERPVKLFAADEIRRMIDAAGTVTLQAMVYLGVNAALGNHDIDELEVRHLDLQKGWMVFPRPKTGVTRKCKLWPETVSALRLVLNDRPVPKDPADRDRVFVTRCGARFIRFEDGRRTDAVHRIFAQLLRDLGIKRKGVSFYSLRHSFRTACDGVDDRAAGVIMGHTPRENDMPTNYVHQVDDTRIEGVVRHVHEWLFGKDGPLFPVTAHLEEDEWRYAFETGVRLADRGLDAVRPVESTVGFLTVQQVARLFGVKDAAVTGWRKAGLLKMVNIAGANARKPRWLVSRADLEEFQAKRQPVAPEPPPQRRKRANRDPDFIEYY